MVLRRRFSYWGRLFLPLIVFLWGLIAVQAYSRYNSEKEFRTEQLANDLELINARIIDAYENDVELEPFIRFIENYYDDTELNGVRISIYDDNDSLMFSSGVPIPIYTDSDTVPEFAEAVASGHGTALRHSSIVDKFYFFDVRRSDDGKIYVHTAMPYTEALLKSVTVDSGMWNVLLLMATVATMFLFFFTRYLAKNVKLLHAFAVKAANGDEIDETVPFSKDELGDVSRKIVSLYRDKAEANERSEREHRLALKINEEKMRMTKQLTNNINHELKTPVGVIKGYLDTLAEHPEMDEVARKRFLDKAREHMDRLCSMLNDLSSMTRLEDGGAGVMREKVDFSELVQNLSMELKNIQLNNGVQFVYNLPPGCFVLGNYNLLYAMIINLVRNADFHSHGTECGIKLLSENNREYRFSFYDNGTGVGEEHLPHLFERFYRIDKGRSRKVGGTGLGLPIVKNTINVMGGAINVKNRDEGGLEFVFTLPKWKENEANKPSV